MRIKEVVIFVNWTSTARESFGEVVLFGFSFDLRRMVSFVSWEGFSEEALEEVDFLEGFILREGFDLWEGVLEGVLERFGLFWLSCCVFVFSGWLFI